MEREYYSQLLLGRLGDVLTQHFNNRSADYVPRVELGQTNIIYNIPHPSLLLHIPDKNTRDALLLLIQEMKRDVIFRRMNLPPSVNQETAPECLAAQIDSTVQRLRSYLQDIGLIKYAKANETLQHIQEINLA
jgi:hypothetical protein